MKKINFVIPCHNEEGNISLFIKSANEILNHEKYYFTYTFVNDGSKDNTLQELKEIAKDNKNIKILNFSRNFGKESAILAGLDYSLKYDATIIIDADLEMPLQYANEMLNFWEQGKKLVVSYRDNRKTGAIKGKLANKFYVIYNKMSDNDIVENALDFQLMDKMIVREIVRFREYNRFFKGITGYIGYEREIIGVSMEERINGTSSFGSFFRLTTYAIKGIAVHSTVLLLLSMLMGIILAFVGAIYFVYIILDKIFFTNAVDGWASLMCMILLFSGVVLISLGIIGYYLGLIYSEVKQRPIYLIQDEINMSDND